MLQHEVSCDVMSAAMRSSTGTASVNHELVLRQIATRVSSKWKCIKYAGRCLHLKNLNLIKDNVLGFFKRVKTSLRCLMVQCELFKTMWMSSRSFILCQWQLNKNTLVIKGWMLLSLSLVVPLFLIISLPPSTPPPPPNLSSTLFSIPTAAVRAQLHGVALCSLRSPNQIGKSLGSRAHVQTQTHTQTFLSQMFARQTSQTREEQTTN